MSLVNSKFLGARDFPDARYQRTVYVTHHTVSRSLESLRTHTLMPSWQKVSLAGREEALDIEV